MGEASSPGQSYGWHKSEFLALGLSCSPFPDVGAEARRANKEQPESAKSSVDRPFGGHFSQCLSGLG